MWAWPWGNRASALAGLFLLASAVYIWGLCPTIYWFDSPEFVTTAHTLGISHPAGSPTYALFAKLATFIPIGSVALRVNAFSAGVAVLSLVLLYALVYEHCATTSPPWTRAIAALSGALLLCVSESFWRFAEVAEVYSLQNCFLVILLTVLLKARTSMEAVQRHYYWLFAFLYGLSAGVHAAMAFFVPAFLGFIGLTTPRMLRSRALAFLAFFFLLGFATYLYLPIRSLTEPAFNWGEPQTWRQFLIHISDRKDAAVLTVFFWRQLPYQLYMYLIHLANEFSTLGVILGLLGCLAVWRQDKPLWFLLTFAWLGHTAFFIRTWWDTAWGFIPSFVIFALWIGFGTHACLALLATLYQRHHLRIPRVAIHTFLLGGIVVTLSQTLVLHMPVANQPTNYATELYGKQLLAQLPPEALLFCEYSWFPLLYLQQVERQRPDLTFILQAEVFVPEYVTHVSTQRFPNIRQVTSKTPITISTTDYFWLLSRLNEPEHPLFWDPDAQYQREISEHLLPQGLLFSFHPSRKVDMTPELLRTHWQLLLRSTNRILQGAREDSTTFLLAHKLNVMALHFRRLGAVAEVTKTYQAALGMRADDKGANNSYGAFLMSQGELSQALAQFNVVYNQDPIHPIVNKNLGMLMLRFGDAAQAAYFFERALAFGSNEGDVYAQLSEAYVKLGRLSPALHALRSALQQYARRTPENAADDRLQEKISRAQEGIDRLERQAAMHTK